MSKDCIIRIKERIEDAVGWKFQNGRSWRCTELYGEPVFLHYVLLKNRWFINSGNISEISVVDAYDFIDLYFNQGPCKVFSPEITTQGKYII